MPITSLSIQQQLQAVSAGFSMTPQIGAVIKGAKLGDEFTRASLTPTDAYEVYTVASTGSGTTQILTNTELELETGTTIGNDVDVRTTGIAFERTANANIDNKSALNFQINFNSQSTADTEIFVGLVRSDIVLTALPTTTRHLGCFLNQSTSDNWFLTSANGTSQVTTDTEKVVESAVSQNLLITYNGIDSATLVFQTLSQTEASQIVTSIRAGGGAGGWQLHWFINTEGAAAKTMEAIDWSCEVG